MTQKKIQIVSCWICFCSYIARWKKSIKLRITLDLFRPHTRSSQPSLSRFMISIAQEMESKISRETDGKLRDYFRVKSETTPKSYLRKISRVSKLNWETNPTTSALKLLQYSEMKLQCQCAIQIWFSPHAPFTRKTGIWAPLKMTLWGTNISFICTLRNKYILYSVVIKLLSYLLWQQQMCESIHNFYRVTWKRQRIV